MKYYVICMKMSRIIKPITKKFGDFGPVKQKRHSPQLNPLRGAPDGAIQRGERGKNLTGQ